MINFLLKILKPLKSNFFGLFLGLLGISGFLLFNIQGNAQSINSLQVFEGISTLEDLINVARTFLLGLAAPLATLVIVWGGYQYFFSGGDEAKTKNGLKAITAGATGLAIVLLASGISQLVQDTFRGGQIDATPLRRFLQDIVIKNLTALGVIGATIAIIYGGYKDFIKAFDVKTEGTESVKLGIFGLSVILLAGAFANTIQNALDGKNDLGAGIQALVDSFRPIFLSTANIFTTLAVVVATLVIAKGGFDFYAGSIDDKAKGLETIQKGVIGLAVILLAGGIAQLTQSFFGDVNNTDRNFDFSRLPEAARTVLAPVFNNGINFLLTIASVIAVLVIVYGAYQYYISSIPGQKAEGQKTIGQGLIGLIVTILSRPIVQLIQVTLKATDNTQLTLEDGTLQSRPIDFSPDGIVEFIKALLSNLVIPISSIITVFFFVIGAYYWITSNGDGEKIKQARSAILNALIGFVVTLMATTIVQLIIYFVKTEEFIPANTDTAGQGFQSSGNTSGGTPGGGVGGQPFLP